MWPFFLYGKGCKIFSSLKPTWQFHILDKYIIFSALDNLVKGASGQAIQNMNILFKFPEQLGLK